MAHARETWWTDPDGVGGIEPERLVFLDECGGLTNMARLHGRTLPWHSTRCAHATLARSPRAARVRARQRRSGTGPGSRCRVRLAPRASWVR